MMRWSHGDTPIGNPSQTQKSAFVHNVVFAHLRVVVQFIHPNLSPPWEANLETPRRKLPTQISMIHPMMTSLTLTSLMVSENALRLQSREVSVRCSKVAKIVRMLTLLDDLDDDATEKRLARLARLEKENKKMKVKLLKASKEAAKSKFTS